MPNSTDYTFKTTSIDITDDPTPDDRATTIVIENDCYVVTILYDDDYEHDKKEQTVHPEQTVLTIEPKGPRIEIHYDLPTRQGSVFDYNLHRYIPREDINKLTAELIKADISLQKLEEKLNELFPRKTSSC